MFRGGTSCASWRWLLAVALLAPWSVTAQLPPPPLYIDAGACPFECCGYTQWIAEEGTLLRRAADSLAAAVHTLQEGEHVEAVTGEVRTVPAPFLVRETILSTSGQRWSPADTIWVLTYIGEGYFSVWQNDTVSLEFSPYGGGMGDRCQNCSHGELLQPYQQEWWIQIRRQNGDVGWTDQAERFSGKDGCGLPPSGSSFDR